VAGVSDFLVITGLSGGGRSTAADNLEDLGWFVVDNLPSQLVEKIGELAGAPGSTITRVALVVGSGTHHADILSALRSLRQTGHRVRILFLEASTPELVRRYGATRRRHPLAETENTSVGEAIERERSMLESVREEADLVIDTTGLNIHQLRARINEVFGNESPTAAMQVTVESFGFKHGLPLDVDLVLDCRFLPNPYWIDRLREHTGLDDDVREYVLSFDLAQSFLEHLDSMLEMLLPAYVAEGKSYLTIALGCTGGRHRSVAIAEELGRRLRRKGHDPRVQHRDLGR
jgi:RNase adapter protein RapZ